MFDSIKKLFKKKRKIKAFFIDETGTVILKKKTYENNMFDDKAENGRMMTYVVDHNFITYEEKTNVPIAFYYKNNPQPIRIRHERNKEVDGIGFKKILDDKTIEDLFGNQGLDKLFYLLVAVGIIIVLQIIMILAQAGVIKLASGG